MGRGADREKTSRRRRPESGGGWLGWLILCVVLAVACLLVGLSLAGWRSSVQVGAREILRSEIEIEVLNGCGVPGMAAEVARLLNASGFDVVGMGNADNFEYPQTVVIDRGGREDYARLVAGALACAEIKQDPAPEALLDVTVVVGADWSGIPGLRASLREQGGGRNQIPGGD